MAINYYKKKTFIPEAEQIPLEDILTAYYECRRRKRKTINALKFEINQEKNLVKLWNDINTKTYTIGQSICFIVTRPKRREVFAADFRDRIVHHIIMQRLKPLFEQTFIEDDYSCRDEKGTLFGVQRLYDKMMEFRRIHNGKCWVGKFDIKGFFMSIHKSILWNKLEKFIESNYNQPDKPTLLWLSKMICLHKPQNNAFRKSRIEEWNKLPPNKSLFTCDQDCGLPIGNLTSQCFANFYMDDFDHWMSNMFGGYYGRYVDDFYVLAESKEFIKSKIKLIREYLKNNLGLTLHPDKIYIQKSSSGVKFIGSVIKPGRIYAGNQTRSNMIKMIHHYNHEYCDVDTCEEFVQRFNSYLGFMAHSSSYNVRKKAWDLVDNKWKLVLKIDKDYKKVLPEDFFNKTKRIKKKGAI